MNGYIINSPRCGRDKNGAFHCVCGSCEALNAHVSDDRDNCGDNCRDSGNSCDCSGDDESRKISSFLGCRRLLHLVNLIDAGDVVSLSRHKAFSLLFVLRV